MRWSAILDFQILKIKFFVVTFRFLHFYTYIENRTIRCPVVAKNDIFNMASVRHLEFKNLYFVQVILS